MLPFLPHQDTQPCRGALPPSALLGRGERGAGLDWESKRTPGIAAALPRRLWVSALPCPAHGRGGC